MNYTYSDELYHFGVKGMKWGVRRYQNEDGTLTEEGRRRLGRYNTKIESARSKINTIDSEIEKIRTAKAKYKEIKDDPFMKSSGEAKRLKKEAKQLTSKKHTKRVALEKRQAEWELAKYKKKADKLQGIANDTKVSLISPKVANAGKAIVGSLLKTAAISAVSAAVTPVAAGAVAGAIDYSNAAGLVRGAYTLAGIDSVGEAAIEGGRQVVSSMLGIGYYTPTERAAIGFFSGKKVW